MGAYSVRCPVCSANIEISPTEQAALQYCPACKDYIADKLAKLEGRTGITTMNASGPNMHPVGGTLTQDVY